MSRFVYKDLCAKHEGNVSDALSLQFLFFFPPPPSFSSFLSFNREL